MFGLLRLELGPNVSWNVSTCNRRSPLEIVLLKASLTKERASFLFLTNTETPLPFFYSVSSSFLLYFSNSFWSTVRTLPNQRRSGYIRPASGSVGLSFIFFKFGLALYMLILLIVAFVLNCEPAFPPAGSGLFGFVEAADFVNADPLPLDFEDLAAMNFLFLSENFCILFDFVVFVMFLLKYFNSDKKNYL
jgi:hypothetical protein